MICPACGKNVQLNAAGRFRPHAVPIEKRPVGAGYTRCNVEGQG